MGIIQGVTEFLPVSSSGHLIVFKNFLGIEQSLVLDVTLHLATLIAVVIYYRKKLADMFKSLLLWLAIVLKVQPLTPKVEPYSKEDLRTIFYLILGSIPAVLIGLTLNDLFESIRSSLVVAAMLIAVSVLMFIDYLKKPTKKSRINVKNSLLIGVAQVVALIPGTSRSGITIVTGSLLGISKKDAADFTFLLSIPVIFGAFILKFISVSDFSYFLNINVVLAFASALISGYFSIGLLLNLLQKYGFLPFIVYRILLAVVILATIFI